MTHPRSFGVLCEVGVYQVHDLHEVEQNAQARVAEHEPEEDGLFFRTRHETVNHVRARLPFAFEQLLGVFYMYRLSLIFFDIKQTV